MPVLEFNENELQLLNPVTGEKLKNYWGYNPVAFFAPKQSYSFEGSHWRQTVEFREMVKAFHRAGIEVILDIVLNHTAENNELGPTICCAALRTRSSICCRKIIADTTRILRRRQYGKCQPPCGERIRHECASLLGHAHAHRRISLRPRFCAGPR